jgi:DNA-binding CsgD family transcriptional regulator
LARIAPEAGISLYLPYVAAVAEAEGNFDEAAQVYQQAVEEGRADDYLLTIGVALAGLARLAHACGDRGRARALYEDGLQIMSALGGMPQVALTHVAVGWLAVEERDVARARQEFATSASLAVRLGHREVLVAALEASAALLASDPRSQPATLCLVGAAQRLREGAHLSPVDDRAAHAFEEARLRVGEPRAGLLVGEGRGMSADVAASLAQSALAALDERAEPAQPTLTPREREVAILLARGCSNRAIAEALVVGRRTAEMHVSNQLAKLELSSRSQVAVWAVQNGLVSQIP